VKGCASLGGCEDSAANGGSGCYLCDVIAKLPQPKSAIELMNDREQKNAARDGAPKLSGEKKRGNLAFQKRRRVGPHR
jgi:hypothetical protein